ncbi:uncharacterized protein F5891DRAFT_1199594 [Suillus fuscotomentosus]|uniref:Uncharacterized protein n=1 Tax=Suillus fuscotomentosus TaxID=1912939 RepID=A0AAD4DP89_9AGAM|nr:uncharacterized protein F5891DRAFT_1199594 [Suillus fuscotomentosus]KAG1887549.1 hypothetical protein F5891DRAFT_1199594 [Suillus fuscotomentosus]
MATLRCWEKGSAAISHLFSGLTDSVLQTIIMRTSDAVPPFYDSEPSAPPPFPSMLTDQLELFGKVHRPSTTLIADEVLVPKASIIVPIIRASSTPAPESELAKRSLKHSDRSFSPYSTKVAFTRSDSQTPKSLDSASSSDSLSDSDSTTSSVNLSEDSKIPKPAGEPGRPGRGGYTLREALDWNPKAYAKFKKYMHRLIEDHLDTTKCASAQSAALLKVVCGKALHEFPDLEDYSNSWPANDMIMTRLKYTSGRARRKEGEMALGKSKSTRRQPEA